VFLGLVLRLRRLGSIDQRTLSSIRQNGSKSRSNTDKDVLYQDDLLSRCCIAKFFASDDEVEGKIVGDSMLLLQVFAQISLKLEPNGLPSKG
jgi:hypothetical protein